MKRNPGKNTIVSSVLSYILPSLLWSAITSHGLRTPVFSSTFTAVLPSTNPNSKLNRAFLQELKKNIKPDRIDESSYPGRIGFTVSADHHNSPTTTATPPLNEWSEILCSGARSVRIVAFDEKITCSDMPQVASEVVHGTNWTNALAQWTAFGNTIPASTPLTVHVRCKRYRDRKSPFEPGCGPLLRRSLASKLQQELGWIPTSQSERDRASIEIHLGLRSDTATLEITALSPPKPHRVRELPRPGFKRVESWAVAKSADISRGDVVLDPMCGRGTFLVEAATFWPGAEYIGVDCCSDQLADAAVNVRDTKVDVELRNGDSTDLHWMESDSVDKILSCPPFGRQFGEIERNAELYEGALLEWSRVLKDDGTMVVVIDADNFNTLMDAVFGCGWGVVTLRDMRLGRLRATIVVVQKNTSSRRLDLPQRGKLEWERTTSHRYKNYHDRALWDLLRAEALPSLIPFNA